VRREHDNASSGVSARGLHLGQFQGIGRYPEAAVKAEGRPPHPGDDRTGCSLDGPGGFHGGETGRAIPPKPPGPRGAPGAREAEVRPETEAQWGLGSRATSIRSAVGPNTASFAIGRGIDHRTASPRRCVGPVTRCSAVAVRRKADDRGGPRASTLRRRAAPGCDRLGAGPTPRGARPAPPTRRRSGCGWSRCPATRSWIKNMASSSVAQLVTSGAAVARVETTSGRGAARRLLATADQVDPTCRSSAPAGRLVGHLGGPGDRRLGPFVEPGPLVTVDADRPQMTWRGKPGPRGPGPRPRALPARSGRSTPGPGSRPTPRARRTTPRLEAGLDRAGGSGCGPAGRCASSSGASHSRRRFLDQIPLDEQNAAGSVLID